MTVKEKPTAVTVDDSFKHFRDALKAALLCELINSSNKDYNTKDPKDIFKKLYKNYYGGAK
jgi:hypothetical protein